MESFLEMIGGVLGSERNIHCSTMHNACMAIQAIRMSQINAPFLHIQNNIWAFYLSFRLFGSKQSLEFGRSNALRFIS
jgi:hypothetical protein